MQNSNFDRIDLPSVEIVRILPKISEEELFARKRCYFGISLDNPHFTGRSLQALLLWGIVNFDQCLVVIGDYLRRYNERIFNGSKKAEAIKAAHKVGDAFMRSSSNFFQQLPKKRVVLMRWEQCLINDEYKNSKSVLDKLFVSDSQFRSAVEKDAFSFVRRQVKQNNDLAVSTEEAIELSCRYLLEEIAVFSALSEQGWKVELYPGPELYVLAEIIKGNFVDVPGGLKERVNVELSINKIKANQ